MSPAAKVKGRNRTKPDETPPPPATTAKKGKKGVKTSKPQNAPKRPKTPKKKATAKPRKKKAPAKKRTRKPPKATNKATNKAPPATTATTPATSSGAPIGDTDTGALRDAVTLALARMSSQGSVPAAGALLKILQGAEEAHAATAHRERLEALEGDTLGQARYFGELGVELQELEDRLRRKPTHEELQAWKAGHRDRALEVRAIELHGLRSSGGKPPPWTKQKP
jgi:hypothetical protein